MKLNEVKTVVDSERGCGWRKPGGLYLRCDGPLDICGKLPVPLEVCPCCSAGIKPARGWTWFNPRPFLAAKVCEFAKVPGDERALKCLCCPMQHAPEKAGLLWVGEKYYSTPAEYMAEARKLGFSRRLSRVPQGYKPGDRVYLAHRCAIVQPCACGGSPPQGETCATCEGSGKVNVAGIFTTFVPDRIEYVTKGDESEADLDALVERGITPVKVVRDIDQPKPETVKVLGETPIPREVPDDAQAEAEIQEIEGSQQ